MPVGEFFGALRRRWLIVLVGLMLTAGLSVSAYMVFKPTYEATATVLLLPPPGANPAGSTNPYLQLGGLSQAVDLVGVSLTDQAAQLELAKISEDVEFTVKADVRTSSPLLVIDVKDSSPETALRIRDILVARVPVRLEEMQTVLSVGAKDRVTSTVVTIDAEAVEVGRNRLRAGVVAAVGGLGLTLVTAALWDSRRLRHPRRRVEATPASTAEPELLSEPELPGEPDGPDLAEPLSPSSSSSPTSPGSPATPSPILHLLEGASDASGDARR